MKLKYIALILFTFSVLTACDDDNDFRTLNGDRGPRGQGEQPLALQDELGPEITARFLGQIIDEQQEPIEDVTITIGDVTTTTDANGVFSVPQATVFTKFAYIKASKLGFVNGSRAIVPTNGNNLVKIMLLSASVTQIIPSGSAATVSLEDGSSVSFSGDFVDDSGLTYTGDVNVILNHLSTEDENMADKMPGMLFAQTTAGNATALITYGMISVELRGSNGQELQLAENTTAQLRFPVSQFQGNPPSTIPLWYFDEDLGYWIEEGEATLQDGMYVGDVAHFSFWNCDIPTEYVTLCITLLGEDGTPRSYETVYLYSENLNNTQSGLTNEDGEVCGIIPAYEQLTIYSGNETMCGSFVSDEIGPYSQDSSIEITIPNSSNYLQTSLEGSFLNCEEEPITNGYIFINYESQASYYPITNGNFQLNYGYCDENLNFSYRIIDSDNNLTTPYYTNTFEQPVTPLGQTVSCQDFSEAPIGNIALIKEGLQSAFFANAIDYTFYVHNVGDSPISNIEITDPQIEQAIQYTSGDDNENSILETNEIWVYEGIYAITQNDFANGEVENQAQVSGLNQLSETIFDLSDNDSVTENDPTITLVEEYTGELTGNVFYDENGNGVHDVGELDAASIDVLLTNNSGYSETVQTDANGYWSAIAPTGNVTIDVLEDSFPNPVQLVTFGSDPETIYVSTNTTTESQPDGYSDQTYITGQVFNDLNGDGIQNGDDIGIAGVDINIISSNGFTFTLTTDADGSWVATLSTGTTHIDVDETTISGNVTLTTIGSDPETFEADFGTNQTTADGYSIN